MNFSHPTSFIRLKNVSYSYPTVERGKSLAVANVSMEIEAGKHVVILGHNGSGKSTVAKLINGLLQPDQGEVIVAGMNTLHEDEMWEIRRLCGMVFQNPDNQIVGTTVEEDVAFGPENLGIPPQEIAHRIDSALAQVNLREHKSKSPAQLSGGQKQKLAIAGILAMEPKCMILDESTSMLDPVSAADFMQVVTGLKREKNLTIIEITHDMEAALKADYVYVMHKGRILTAGTPREIFTNPQLLLEANLEIPAHLDVLYHLDPASFQSDKPAYERPFTYDEVIARLQIKEDKPEQVECLAPQEKNKSILATEQTEILRIEHLSYTYSEGTEFVQTALDDINFSVNKGEFIALVGHSGSGKSTLITHLNGLYRAKQGKVFVAGECLDNKENIQSIRSQVGLLFQYPEYQLFEETVFADIAFGPTQLKFEPERINQAVHQAARDVGLAEDLLQRSPFELSGGQKRRVAIAGVLAMEPDILVLDEPAAGLDPMGRLEILGYLNSLKQQGKTIILVTHNMADAAELADRIVVLNKGKLIACDTPQAIFSNAKLLQQAGLDLPPVAHFANYLSTKLGKNYSSYRLGDLISELKNR